MPILFANQPCADALVTLRACTEHQLPTEWYDGVNRFESGHGRDWGRGEILLARSELDSIDLTADHSLMFFGANPDASKTLRKITIIGARNLTPGALEDGRAVYLCEIVDRRYHLARIPCNTAYNVRSATSGELLEESLNSGTAWTWAEVVEELWDMLGAGTVPTLPFTPDGDPENLVYWGGWAWDAVNDVLARIGCTVRYWAEEDEFTFIRLGETDSASDAEADRLEPQRTWDSEPFDPVRAWRPQKVRVRFLRSPLPSDGSSPYYTVDVTLDATSGVVTGSYEQLDDDLAALGATGAPTNAAALTTRAEERADDWLRKRENADRPELIVFRDIQPNAGTLLGSVRGTIALEDRSGARTSTKSEPDGAMERWRPLTGVPKWWPPGGSGGGATTVAPFAVLTETTGASSWQGREVNIGSGAWSSDGNSGTDNARPFLMDGATFTPKPGANVLLFEDSGGGLGYLPVQSADLSSGTYYPGYVTTGAQSFKGVKTFVDNIVIQDDATVARISLIVDTGVPLISVGSSMSTFFTLSFRASGGLFPDSCLYFDVPGNGLVACDNGYMVFWATAGGGPNTYVRGLGTTTAPATDPVGNKFVGGIIVELGTGGVSGSFP